MLARCVATSHTLTGMLWVALCSENGVATVYYAGRALEVLGAIAANVPAAKVCLRAPQPRRCRPWLDVPSCGVARTPL
jgi:hypothetical protein